MNATRLLWTSSLLAAVLLSGGCFDRTNTVDVQLIKSNDCGSGPDPMQDVTHLRVRFIDATRCGQPIEVEENGETVSKRFCQIADGLECGSDTDCGFGTAIKENVVEVSAGKMDFEQLEAGRDLQVQVAGFSGSPSDTDSRILSFGQSGSFKVPQDKAAEQPAAKALVFFRQVEKFSPVNLGSDPTVRTMMNEARAGHTATVLDDGRVLITGGFDTTGVSTGNLKKPEFWTYKDTVEIFDPATGEITADVPVMNKLGVVTTKRAFHTASWKEGNQVLIAGGEYVEVKSGVRSQTLQSNTILFDPTITDDNGVAKGGWAPQPSRIMRSRHVAVTEQTGMVLLYGGLSFDGTSVNVPTYVQSYEWFDPSKNLFTKLDTVSQSAAVTAVGHVALPLYNGKYLGVVGGSMLDTGNAGKLNKDCAVRFNLYKDSKMQEQAFISLPVPRTYASVSGQGKRYIIVGGFQSFDPNNWWDLLPGNPYTGTDILNLANSNSQPEILQGPSLDVARGHTCAVTLKDGRMLVVGGRGGRTTIESLPSTAFFADDGNADPMAAFSFEKGDDMADPRFFHTCTLLKDGSVLVTGGIQEKGAAFATLQTMEIFVPRPARD
ncbi:MAG: kelch repeat-containing protein [Myxococcales bacterium]